jgi:hypothetical protein
MRKITIGILLKRKINMGHFIAMIGTIAGVLLLLAIYGIDWKRFKK